MNFYKINQINNKFIYINFTEINCSHCESMSLTSLCSQIAFFPRSLWGKKRGVEDLSARIWVSSRWSRVPRSLLIERFHLCSFPTQTSVPLPLRVKWSCLGDLRKISKLTACFWWPQTRRIAQAKLTTPPPWCLWNLSTPELGWTLIFLCIYFFTHCHRMESKGSSPIQALKDDLNPCWKSLHLSWPKITLDPTPQKSSWSIGHQEEPDHLPNSLVKVS